MDVTVLRRWEQEDHELDGSLYCLVRLSQNLKKTKNDYTEKYEELSWRNETTATKTPKLTKQMN